MKYLLKYVATIPFLILLIYCLVTGAVKYSFGFVFAAAALLHGVFLVWNMKNAERRKWDFFDGLALWVYSTAACYVHYHWAVLVAAIYAVLLVWMLVLYFRRMLNKSGDAQRVNFKALALLVVAINLTAVCYFPRLIELIGSGATPS